MSEIYNDLDYQKNIGKNMKIYDTFEGLPKQRMEYVGIEEELALQKIEEDGFFIHVGYRDGVDYPMSASLCPSRISLSIINNITTDAIQG